MPFPDPTGGGVTLPLDHDNPAEITGVSPDDHHPEVHAIDGVDHTGVLVDGQIPASIARDSELHAEVHAIGGADHTGAITDAQHGARGPIVGAHGHDDLDTIGVNDHHNRDHSIIGAEQTGFPGGTTQFLRADKVFAVPPGGGGNPPLTTVEVDLGGSKRAGQFNVAGAGLTVGNPVMIQQGNGPYTGKGTLTDEAEMDQVTVSGKVTSATNIECFWTAPHPVRGNVKFDYFVGG